MVTKVVTRGQFLLPSPIFRGQQIGVEFFYRPGQKIALDHMRITYADLDVQAVRKIGSFINRFTFLKRAADGVIS